MEEYLTAVTHHGKMVTASVAGGALCTWEPALVQREHSHNGSQVQYNKTHQSQRLVYNEMYFVDTMIQYIHDN